jgi:uncharacterized membrane protein
MIEMLNALLSGVKHLEPVRFFVIVGAIFGLLFVFITPPFQGADEVVHFYRTYQISSGNLVVDTTNQGAGGYLPTSLGKTVAVTQTPPIAFYPQLKYENDRTADALSIKTDDSSKKYYNFSSTTSYSPVPYLPGAIGMAAGNAFNAPAILLLYLARIGNLAFWLVCMALAIRFLPHKKWALSAIALLPMAIFQSATLNCDPATIGLTTLFLSLILYFREQKQVSNKQLVGLFAVAVSMVLTKSIMPLFLPLALLLGNKLFVSRRRAILVKLGLFILPIMAVVAWMLLVSGIDASPLQATNQQNPAQQLKFMILNPHSFINVLWNTYFYTWGDSVFSSFIGTFGWADAPLSEPLVVLGYLGLALLIIGNPLREKIISIWLQKRENY